MPSPKPRFVVACAGSRKTTSLVEAALAIKDERVAITTYTNENVDQIVECFVRLNEYVPSNVTVQSWFSFLLQEGVRPYQNYLVGLNRIEGIDFHTVPPRFAPKKDTERFYLAGRNIYSDRVSDFVWSCNQASGGRVISRLGRIYRHLFIDEVQDFAGYDWDLLDLLVKSGIDMVAVGDPRQATFATNRGSKNKQFKGAGMVDWIEEQRQAGLVDREDWTDCYRCNQAICDFADSLYPALPSATSKMPPDTGHDGIFVIKSAEAADYFATHQPVVLRWRKDADTLGLPAVNIGLMKGRTFPRVMLFSTAPMKKFLKTKNPEDAGSLAKFYVAVTRAKYSVAIVV